MDPRRLSVVSTVTSFPRTRGDGPVLWSSTMNSSAFPPHARGWTALTNMLREGLTVSPARAGMDRSGAAAIRRAFGFPRTRGDGPVKLDQVRREDGFPPHARGWTCRMVWCANSQMVSPARAGMDPSGYARSCRIRGFPRTRGDGPLGLRQLKHLLTFPPHARGWTGVTDGHILTYQVSPARAGMDPRYIPSENSGNRFPRTRGDGPWLVMCAYYDGAFPPHARGWTPMRFNTRTLGVVSPARAGMDRGRNGYLAAPRSFPRTRGDGPRLSSKLGNNGRFPPHARGWTPVDHHHHDHRSVSPARAGMDPRIWETASSPRRFPRTRGDGPDATPAKQAITAFPPPARGWTESKTGRGQLTSVAARCPASGAPSSRYPLLVQVCGQLCFPGVERNALIVPDM